MTRHDRSPGPAMRHLIHRPRRTMRRSTALLATSAALAAVAPGCTVDRVRDDAAATPPAADTVDGAARTSAGAPASTDTATGLAVDAPPSESSAVRATADTVIPTATTAELAALRTQLVVPVQGVKPADLHDSYTEARGGRVHEALDIAAPRGTPVVSAADGRVLKLHESAAGGHMIYAADSSNRFVLLYAHLDGYAPGLAAGMPVHRGQLLGYVGTSGNANPATPHLHFGVARARPSVWWWRGVPVNPYPLLAP